MTRDFDLGGMYNLREAGRTRSLSRSAYLPGHGDFFIGNGLRFSPCRQLSQTPLPTYSRRPAPPLERPQRLPGGRGYPGVALRAGHKTGACRGSSSVVFSRGAPLWPLLGAKRAPRAGALASRRRRNARRESPRRGRASESRPQLLGCAEKMRGGENVVGIFCGPCEAGGRAC